MLTELERPKPSLIVRLDQLFPAFSQEFTMYRRPLPGEILINSGKLNTRIHLILDKSLPTWPLNISAADFKNPKNNTLTPFNPEAGYIISREDFRWETRKEKLEASWSQYGYNDRNTRFYWTNEATVHEIAPFWFQIHVGDVTVKEIDWLYAGSPRNQVFNPAVRPILERLYLQVLFPHFACEAKCPDSPPALGIYFARFYPLDVGPLPYDPEDDLCKRHPFINAGLNIHLPANFSDLTKVQARFVLRDEKNNLLEVNQAKIKNF